MKKNTMLWVTALMAVGICVLSVPLVESEYWLTAIMSFAIAFGWLGAFLVVNIRRLSR